MSVLQFDIFFPLLELQIGLCDDLIIGKTSQVGYGSSVRLDHANFHPSVDLSEFDQKRTVIIHPAEGQVGMTYRRDRFV